MSRRQHRGRRAGFTLLEVVISMVLLALVAGICYAAFHLGTRGRLAGLPPSAQVWDSPGRWIMIFALC